MRLPEGATIRWEMVALLAVGVAATIALLFLVPAVGWMIVALGVLTAGVTLNPSRRKSRPRDEDEPRNRAGF